MGKHDFMTAKAVANRIKAKGLNKLRWYCQPCNKSCRDENGYKCHINTEAHHRAMMLFAENAQGMLTDYSRQFKQGFMDILRTRYGTRRVYANQVYNEYIADRHHIHMNATCWTTLSAFVKYLGREGEVKAEEDDRGWYITYIDRSPETLARMEKDAKREREERDAEGEEQRLIEEQIRRAHQELERRKQLAQAVDLSEGSSSPSDASLPLDAADTEPATLDSQDRSPTASPAPTELVPPSSSTAASGPAATPPKQPIKLGLGLKPPAKSMGSLTTVASGGVAKKKSLASLMSKSTALSSATSAGPASSASSGGSGLALHALIEEDRERQRRKEEAMARRATGASSGTGKGGRLAFGGSSASRK